MSANDNAMTRFLFAILRQKCLKDIDWNKVAHDPILAQEITNGHAARMRYSRFRSAMLGLEPQRRNRTSPNKSKVSKSKKDGKSGSSKKEEESFEDETSADSKPSHAVKAERKSSHVHHTSKVKAEAAHLRADEMEAGMAILSAAPAGTVALADTQLHTRLLTPCSDLDFLSTPSAYSASPASDMLPPDASFDFAMPTPEQCSHETSASWPVAADAYASYGMGYDVDAAFAMGMCEHQSQPHGAAHEYVQAHSQLHNDGHRHQEPLCIRTAVSMESASLTDSIFVNSVKHEEWDGHSY